MNIRYIPEGANEITRDNLPAIVYAYTNKSGRPAAVAYIGKQSKPAWHYQFKNEEQREMMVNRLFDNVAYTEGRKAERKAERASFKHGFVVGDILYSSWGYEQTNIEYYEITATTEKTVTFREIAHNSREYGFMCSEATPRPGEYISREYTRRVGTCHRANSDKGAVNFAEHEGGYMRRLWAWDGNPKTATHYA